MEKGSKRMEENGKYLMDNHKRSNLQNRGLPGEEKEKGEKLTGGRDNDSGLLDERVFTGSIGPNISK